MPENLPLIQGSTLMRCHVDYNEISYGRVWTLLRESPALYRGQRVLTVDDPHQAVGVVEYVDDERGLARILLDWTTWR